MQQNTVSKIIAEYSPEYCAFLEAAYGNNMMSEGGSAAIDHMLEQESLTQSTILDIGFGLGGMAMYLAEKYDARVSGVEINPWMVKEATSRIPSHLKNQVHFTEYHPDRALPFNDNTFDFILSKGVLVHLDNKTNLFTEIKRTLKPNGAFIGNDWLSPQAGTWGNKLKKMCEAEDLTLYAQTVNDYQSLFDTLDFSAIEFRDDSPYYGQYNLEIVNRLQAEKTQQTANPAFNNFSIDEAIDSYQLIADSMNSGELKVYWFKAMKAAKVYSQP